MKYTALIGTDMSGRLGGIIASRNKYGPYFRNGVIPVNPQSPRQSLVRSVFQILTNRWSSKLTEANRNDWKNYAANVPILGANGSSQFITGFAMYVRCNSARVAAGGTAVDAGPATLSMPEVDSTVVVTAVAATQLCSVSFNATMPWAAEVGGFLFVHMGLPQLLTRCFFKGPFRYMDKVAGAIQPPTSPKTMTAPFSIVVGQKLFFQLRVARADGRLSNLFCPAPCISA